jgi:hypothetical protein
VAWFHFSGRQFAEDADEAKAYALELLRALGFSGGRASPKPFNMRRNTVAFFGAWASLSLLK